MSVDLSDIYSAGYVPEDFFCRHGAMDIFGKPEPFEVDLGCGDGGFLLQMAKHYPERHFLGVEKLLGRVRKVCSQIQKYGLQNVRVLRIESSYFLEWFLEAGVISRLHYLCPDPWPKTRHHKNRLIQDRVMSALHRVLSDGGEVLFKTDHDEYFEWVLDHFARSGLFDRCEWKDEDFFYPKTDFQLHWEKMGKPIYRARFVKKS